MSTIARLAPSPTGALHLGNARSFLIAWLSARSQNGTIFLRIEDIDSPRIKPASVQQIFDDFRWLGLDWDGEPVVQTSRLPIYQAALDNLKRRELVYPCTCSRTDVERAASAPHSEHEGPIYPGTCRGRLVADADRLGDRPYSWRLRTDDLPLTWVDGFRGQQALAVSEVGGDFVVWKFHPVAAQVSTAAAASSRGAGAAPAYQLAVVVDDAAMGITEVVRGDDLVPSTPRQLFLYQLFGWTPPRFYHVPLVVGRDGRRLAKRHGDTRVSTFHEQGVAAESMLGWLAASCGWIPPNQKITARELIPLFRWETIPRQAITLTDPPH
jgi:glutamyl-tRNA synthetase